MSLKKIFAILVCFLWTYAHSQTELKKKYYSAFVKDSIAVTVWLPVDYASAEAYPVFYEFVYDHSNYMASVLQNYFDAPKSIVVHANFDAGNAHYSHPGLTAEGNNNYQFLIRELIPAIEKEFNTTNYRVAVGLSQGADYANYILRNNPELFKAWLIFSIEKPNYEPDFYAYSRKINTPVDYFIAIADDEPNRIAFAHRLDSNLKNSRYFHVQTQTYLKSTHAYSILYGFPDALKFIFDSYINLRSTSKKENLYTYYTNLQQEIKSKYGIEPEFNNLLSHVLQELKTSKDTTAISALLQDILPKSSQLQLFNVAYTLTNVGLMEKAEQLLKHVAMITPKEKKDQQLNPVMPYRTLAFNIYDKQGEYEKAFQTLLEGHTKVKSYDVGLLYYIGIYSLRHNFHISEGIKAFEEVLSKRESSAISAFFSEDTINAQIADGYARMHHKKQAKFYAKKALMINPANTDAKKVLDQL